MENFVLEAASRDVKSKSRKSTNMERVIPAVVYGHGLKSQSIAIPLFSFEKIFKKAGTNTLISLKLNSGKKQVLIYDYQQDPVSDQFIHVDFYAVKMDEKIEAAIPLKFIGIPGAVKDKGGVLVKNMEDVKVRCLPVDLPHEIEVDLSVLNSFEDRIRISDLKVGGGVEILIEDKMQVVANAILPKEEKEEVEGKPEENVQAVEGIKLKEGEVVAEGSKKDKKEGQREVKKESKKK
ncbi:50S ribosomal protein L25 [Patescibacteria group bacterium]|nr:50S ribosomal protein L25 [Patescibacteria group bacterium]MBU4579568.1 50S ribosomal protein L25 [Patescibacteria group bacterium]